MSGKRVAIPASVVTLGTALLTQPVCAAVCPKADRRIVHTRGAVSSLPTRMAILSAIIPARR